MRYIDCDNGHVKERISGATDDELVSNYRRHLMLQHKGIAAPTREAVLALAQAPEG